MQIDARLGLRVPGRVVLLRLDACELRYVLAAKGSPPFELERMS